MATILDADTPINEYLSFKISVLYRLMVRRSARYLNHFYDLSVAEWWTIGQLAVNSPSTVSEIVDATQNDKAQVSRSATNLIAMGYVQKQDNPLDKRSSLLSLTDSGKALYEKVIPIRQKTQNLLLEQLTEEERAVTERAIMKMTNYLLDHPELVIAAE
jgi:DNA-binding MarR family transcriptional regulator